MSSVWTDYLLIGDPAGGLRLAAAAGVAPPAQGTAPPLYTVAGQPVMDVPGGTRGPRLPRRALAQGADH